MGFAYSLCALISYLAVNGIKSRPEVSLSMSMEIQESSVIHTNREKIVSNAIKNKSDMLLFLDHDMVFDPSILDVLLGRRQPIVITNYKTKKEGGRFTTMGLDYQPVATTEDSTGLLPVAYGGFGVSLFDVEVFKSTPQPWFMPKFDAENNCYTTEDNPCFERLREAGHTVYLDHDASKLITGHVGQKAYTWREGT
jgi:hypothetical protein